MGSIQHYLPSLARFLFSQDQAAQLRAEFEQIATDIRLHSADASVRSSMPQTSGCYFWTLRDTGREYRIYVGRTKSMKKRFADYASDIQIHAPNDQKLRFFQEFIHELDETAAFDLYFMRVPEMESKARERLLVDHFKPLINSLRRPTPEDRESIRNGFRAYYRDAFTHSGAASE